MQTLQQVTSKLQGKLFYEYKLSMASQTRMQHTSTESTAENAAGNAEVNQITSQKDLSSNEENQTELKNKSRCVAKYVIQT